MKFVRHTEGTWVVTPRNPLREHDPLYTIDVADDDGGLVSMVARVGSRFSKPNPEAAANAALLAAAPELLAVLREVEPLLAVIDHNNLAPNHRQYIREALLNARAVIGKLDIKTRELINPVEA